MSLYTRLAASVLFPFHECVKGHSTLKVLREMEQRQWQATDQILEYQRQRLQNFIVDVANHVPYYRGVFVQSGLEASDIQSVKDLQKLPFLTKDEIRENSDALRSDRARDLSRFNTGGSSGEPLVFYIGKERVSHDVAAKWRATRWWNVDIGDKEIVLWGSPIELGGQDYIKMVRDKLLRTELLPAFEMSELKISQFLDRIEAFKPTMLFGYPSAYALLAQHARQQNRQMDKLGLRVAFVTSEKLYEHQRELIEKVFGCPVANGYGGRDAGFIAHQCPSGKLHITAEDIIVEIVDEGGKVLPSGERGEIVITHLATRDYPFIRYKTGDIGTLSEEPCACGRGLPVLEEIEGRTTDFVVAADGTIMHGLALIYILRDLEFINEFKIVQESTKLIRVILVSNRNLNGVEEKSIEIEFQKRLGESVKVQLENVAKIAPERSGKKRYVVSNVDINS